MALSISPELVGILGLCLLLILVFLRVPVAYAMITVGLLGMAVLRGWSAGVQTVVTTLYNKFTSYSFSAVPLFILMGYLAYHAGMLERLFDTAKKWIGHFHGGLTNSGIVGGAAFGAVCGSGNAAGATLARVVLPELLNAGTSRPLAFGAVCSAGILAPLIPPSVIGMLIAVVLEVSIGQVLIGGLLPGLLCAALFMIYVYVSVKRDPSRAPVSEKSNWKERFKSLVKIWDFVIICLLVVVGIYTGLFSATEAGAVSSAAVIVILLIRRSFSFKIIFQSIIDTMRTTASAFFIVGTSFVFGSFLTLTRLPSIFASWLVNLPVPHIVIMLFIVVFFIIVGMFMDALSVVYITVPILAPTVEAFGYDLVWFAVLLLMLCTIGAITPPFGAGLFVVKASIEDSTMSEIYKGVIPFVIATVISILLCLFFPQIIMVLPNLMV